MSTGGRTAGWIYAVICWTAAIWAVGHRLYFRRFDRTARQLALNHTRRINTVQRLGHRPAGSLTTAVLSRIPGNQVFELWVQHKTVQLQRLPTELDGLTITHLSDLHFTGRITRDFHDLVIDQANSLASDLIVIAGDIIDKQACRGWLSEVLGKLRAPHGVYFVLGNHDLRIHDEAGLRADLVGQGMVDLGGRHQLIEVRGQPILLAGNELPWFRPAADLRGAPVATPHGRPLRIAVAHSPDQFAWARQHDFDLMLAGHTHGGQIRLPLVGPVFSPSLHGIRYSAGTFFRQPTLMHVSRGISATRPLRFDCAPELTQLKLVAR